VVLSVALFLVYLYFHLLYNYLDFLVRVFLEKPLFIIPRGQPVADAEDVQFPTTDGLTLRGCYLPTTTARRQGVILFGLEFGSNRWACVPYCQFLRDNGFDIFAFESRSQGDSDAQPGYEPLQWVTDYEVRDVRAALAYLKGRPDTDPRGVGFFGISKGGSAGLLAAADDLAVRCFVTDGIFATRTTMIPYMRKWIAVVSKRYFLQRIMPSWYYGLLADAGLRRIHRETNNVFPHLERALPRLAPRPLLMIHGGGDTYIKPDMAHRLFARARAPKEFWLVDGAKHNQALQLASDEYQQRVLAFFRAHLAHDSQTDTQHPFNGYPVPAGLKRTPAALGRAETREPIGKPR
jgi:pimeloyl-ACP methyl ester carboxylesterase